MSGILPYWLPKRVQTVSGKQHAWQSTHPANIISEKLGIVEVVVRRTLRHMAAMWLALLALGSVPAYSQVSLSVRGTVTDPSGAAVPNATVHLINAANADRTATTDQSCAYTFQKFAPGAYQLRVDAPGFEDYAQSNIRLDTSASTTLDVKLKIVQVQENVKVTAQIGQQCLAAQGRIFPDVGPGLRAIRRSSSGNYYVLTAPGAVAIYNADGKKIGQVPAEAIARLIDYLWNRHAARLHRARLRC